MLCWRYRCNIRGYPPNSSGSTTLATAVSTPRSEKTPHFHWSSEAILRGLLVSRCRKTWLWRLFSRNRVTIARPILAALSGNDCDLWMCSASRGCWRIPWDPNILQTSTVGGENPSVARKVAVASFAVIGGETTPSPNKWRLWLSVQDNVEIESSIYTPKTKW
jgi:hypothetical protein